MLIKTIALTVVVAMLATACASTVVSSNTTSAFNQAVTSINVVYVEANLTPRYGGVISTTQNRANQHRQELGVKIMELMPATFSSHGISSQAKSLSPASVPSDAAGFRELFLLSPGAPVLLIHPVSAVTSCPGACFVYRMQAKLVNTDTGMTLWTSTIDTPSKLSRFSDYSDVAQGFSEAVVAEMRKRGVIKAGKAKFQVP